MADLDRHRAVVLGVDGYAVDVEEPNATLPIDLARMRLLVTGNAGLLLSERCARTHAGRL